MIHSQRSRSIPWPAPLAALAVALLTLPPAASAEGGAPEAGEGDGPPATVESALTAAVDWLLRHQDPDGSWRAIGFRSRCVNGPCRNEDLDRYGPGVGNPAYDVGLTGLAALALVAELPRTHGDRFKRLRDALERALDFLARIQVRGDDPNTRGCFGPVPRTNQIYNHAIAALAVCRYVALAGDARPPRLVRCAGEAARFCLRAQNAGYGWEYGVKAGRNNTSVTGWMTLALLAARECPGIEIAADDYKTAFEGVSRWLDRATSVASGRTGYQVPGDKGSQLQGHPNPYPYSKELSSTTAIAVACRLALGEDRSEPVAQLGVDLLLKSPPEWREPRRKLLSTINAYYWLWGTMAMARAPGLRWKEWRDGVTSALLDHQRRGGENGDGDERGSWDPIGEWGAAGGRVYSTALGVLALAEIAAADAPKSSPAETSATVEPPLPEVEGFELAGRNPQGFQEYRHVGTGLVFVYLPGGRFEMGSQPEEEGRIATPPELEARHTVELSAFLISKHEVSQKVWSGATGASPSRFEGPALPVERVTWVEANRFARRLDMLLPTEAQWEHACRGGSDAAFAFGDALDKQANFGEPLPRRNPETGAAEATRPVDSFAPNGFGLFNVHGNVAEWCRDRFAPDFWASDGANQKDPISTRGDGRVVRGGSWKSTAAECRAAARASESTRIRRDTIGVRLVRELR